MYSFLLNFKVKVRNLDMCFANREGTVAREPEEKETHSVVIGSSQSQEMLGTKSLAKSLNEVSVTATRAQNHQASRDFNDGPNLMSCRVSAATSPP